MVVDLKWVPEIKHFLGSVDIMLVGTKKDLRDEFHIPSGHTKCVSYEDVCLSCYEF